MADRKKDIVKTLQGMSLSHPTYETFRDWVKLCALAIVNRCSLIEDDVFKQREKEYLATLDKYCDSDKEKFPEMFAMLIETMDDEFGDVLGEIYMESMLGNKNLGQFFTPFHLSELNAKVALANTIPANEKITINEPTCGGGGLIIAAAKALRDKGIDYQRKMEVVAQDLDWNSVYMCYVQLSLYGISGLVCQSDTLSDPDIKKYPKFRKFETPRRVGMLVWM